MIKKILMAVAAVLVLFLGFVATRPADYMISREISINASPEKIFPYINDAKKMNSWSPWTELDPKSKVNFDGAESGVGARTSWTGGDQLGTGSATVTESIPNAVVKTRLEYTEPFEMSQSSYISLTPSGEQTVVIWSISGKNNFIGRIFTIFMDPEKLVGGTFEKGLLNLKKMIETQNLN